MIGRKILNFQLLFKKRWTIPGLFFISTIILKNLAASESRTPIVGAEILNADHGPTSEKL